MTERVAISEDTKKLLSQFRDGAGLTYDEAIELMILTLTNNGADDPGEVAALLNYARKSGKTVSKPEIID